MEFNGTFVYEVVAVLNAYSYEVIAFPPSLVGGVKSTCISCDNEVSDNETTESGMV
jgi:hypothetical protein